MTKLTSLNLKSVFKQTFKDAIDDALTEKTISVQLYKIYEYAESLYRTY